MTKAEAAEAVLAARRHQGLRWGQLGEAIGRSTVWTTTALLGRHRLTLEQARVLGGALALGDDAVDALSAPPDRGELGVDRSDPLIARLDEMVQVYGPTIRELVLEEFGDGIISAIDFEMTISRRPDPKGDRVVLTLDGKFLPYRTW
ncbi:MAG: cyanate lyase [Actinomycetota bacterium]|nr:cyanate lyase [Actinomycetota bacterium]